MEISLSNVREMGMLKISNSYFKDRGTYFDSIRELSFALSGYKVPAFSFLKYWDLLKACDDSRLSNIKTWALQLDPMISTIPSSEIDRSSKRKFSHSYSSVWRRLSVTTDLSDVEVNSLMELGLKLPFAVLLLQDDTPSDVYRLTGTVVVEHLEELINFACSFYSAVFAWEVLASSDIGITNKGKSLLDLVRFMVITGNKEFSELLQTNTLLDGDIF